MNPLTPLLRRFTSWALSKYAPGGYAGEDDRRRAYTIETDGDKYLTRVILLPRRIFGANIYLHNFHRADADRYLHNHPWRWTRSIVLSGSYDEERLAHPELEGCLDVVERAVRWFNKIGELDYHRVTKLHGDVWTLFITGPRIQDWGFLTEQGHVPWQKFLGGKS